MPICEECGNNANRVRNSKEFNKVICDNCYKTLKYHPFIYIPPKGEIHYDDKGRVICHICGRAYNVLSTHVVGKHKKTVKEYKEMFELNRTSRLTSELIQEKYKNNPSVDISTIRIPFKKGHTATKGLKKRLQAIKNRTGVKYHAKANEEEKEKQG